MAGIHHRAGYGILVLAAACTVGPDYEPPAPKLPGGWSQQLAGGLIPGTSRLTTWWETLGDSHLAALIRRAVRGNPGLAAALARIQASQAVQGQITGQNFPDIDGGGSLNRFRDSRRGSLLPARALSLHDLGLSMFWEIDLFGRIRRAKESASAQVDATVEDYRDVLTVLQTQVGVTFVQLRTVQRQIQLLQENIRLQQETRTLAKDRFSSGVAAELDVFQAESNLANSQAQLPGLELRQAQLTHRLAVLLGEPAGALRAELASPRPLPTLPTSVAVGIPADLLRRRPDIRRAERQLAAQHAQIGATKALLFPIFSLTGALGLSSFSSGNLLNRGSQRFSIAPGFSWNLIDGGRVRGAVKEERARTSEAELVYENTVLLALEEAENAIAAFRRNREQRAALIRVVDAARNTSRLARDLYKQGLRNFQNVLDAERTLTLATDALAQSEGAEVTALIDLFRALGGGWSLEDASPADEAAEK